MNKKFSNTSPQFCYAFFKIPPTLWVFFLNSPPKKTHFPRGPGWFLQLQPLLSWSAAAMPVDAADSSRLVGWSWPPVKLHGKLPQLGSFGARKCEFSNEIQSLVFLDTRILLLSHCFCIFVKFVTQITVLQTCTLWKIATSVNTCRCFACGAMSDTPIQLFGGLNLLIWQIHI